MTRLQQEVQQGERDIGTAEGQISTLKEAQDKLLEELDATRARLRETSNLLTALQVGISAQTRVFAHCDIVPDRNHQRSGADLRPEPQKITSDRGSKL